MSAARAESVAPATTSAARSVWRTPRILRSGLGLAVLASTAITAIVLFGLGGWQYYSTAPDVRAYTELHPLLRPSGLIGRALGMAGLALMLVMHVYTIRKRARWMRRLGRVTVWLEFHIFCGVLGPVLITLHTSFKFNGLVSVAYWSMVVVVLSGFIGRYLYVQIPRSIRGRELDHDEVAARAGDLAAQLLTSGLDGDLLERIRVFEESEVPQSSADVTWTGLLIGEARMQIRLALLARAIRHSGGDRQRLNTIVALIAERAALLRRIAYLKKTKKLFDLWRVYHKPLAILMALIVVLHVATAWYFGYAFGGAIR